MEALHHLIGLGVVGRGPVTARTEECEVTPCPELKLHTLVGGNCDRHAKLRRHPAREEMGRSTLSRAVLHRNRHFPVGDPVYAGEEITAAARDRKETQGFDVNGVKPLGRRGDGM